jgi:spore germination protein GerM
VRRRAITIAATTVLLVGPACAIQPDSSPRDIPAGERVLLDPVDPEAGASAGSSRIFVLTSDGDNGERSLRSVQRTVPDPEPQKVIEELILGPNQQELDAGLRSALPDELTVHSARRIAGTLNVDLSPEILELGGPQLRLAVAAIVFTADELDGVRNVRLRVDGANRDWPDGRGELQSGVLSVYDFPGIVESTQPPFPPVPSEPVA